MGTDEELGRTYNIPFHDFIGLEVERHEGGSRVVVPLGDAVRGGVAPLHGGILATLVDVSCAVAIGRTWDPAVEIPVSTDLQVKFYGQPKASPIVAEAEVVHRGKKIIGVECVVRDGNGKQIGRGSGSYMIVPGFGELAEGNPPDDA
jgi:uncharacterized protein (TIGR00369 family)